MTAQDTPGPVFTAYKDFMMRIVHTAGTSVVALQQDLNDDSTWYTIATSNPLTGVEFSVNGTHIVEVPDGCASKFRTMITTLSTGPVGIVVVGKLNANDTIGGFSPGFVELEEGGDQVVEEDGTSIQYEEAA
jgi:hypothetical protein